MPFIRATHPEAGDNINGVQFVPHPDGKGKVSVLSVAADLAQIFCDVPGFETCPDPGLPQSPAPVSEGTKPFDQMTVEEHKAEIEALQALGTMDQPDAAKKLEEVLALAREDKREQIVDIAGRSIGVFNVNGEFFALRNRCPHQGGPLCNGHTSGFVTSSSPGEYHVTRQGEIVRCPWHGWEFDIRTGQALYDERLRVKTYLVQQEGNEIILYV